MAEKEEGYPRVGGLTASAAVRGEWGGDVAQQWRPQVAKDIIFLCLFTRPGPAYQAHRGASATAATTAPSSSTFTTDDTHPALHQQQLDHSN